MLVSIITVSYNSAKTIKDTLTSVANQTYTNIEHIIIDGKSTDDTIDIVKQFPHVKKIVSEKDKGLYDAMNKGLQLATGDVIGILNSDDFYTNKDVIQEVVDRFKQDRYLEVVYSNLKMVAADNISKVIRTWKLEPYYDKLFAHGKMPPHPTLFVKKNVYDKVGYFDTRYSIAADYDLMLRVFITHQAKSQYVNSCWVTMRLGGESTKGISGFIKSSKETLIVWKRNWHTVTFRYLFGRLVFMIKQFLR